jgi:hypothetical protein
MIREKVTVNVIDKCQFGSWRLSVPTVTRPCLGKQPAIITKSTEGADGNWRRRKTSAHYRAWQKGAEKYGCKEPALDQGVEGGRPRALAEMVLSYYHVRKVAYFSPSTVPLWVFGGGPANLNPIKN